MPALVLLGIFMVYPILWSLWMSFQTGRGMNFTFGGFANIVRLTQDPIFLRALGNTFTFLIVQVPIMLVLALLFATALIGNWRRSPPFPKGPHRRIDHALESADQRRHPET